MTYLEIRVGDIVRMRKLHPCGGWEWEVVRTGADIGIVCLQCKRKLFMPRDKFRRAVKCIERSQYQAQDNTDSTMAGEIPHIGDL